MPSGSHRQAGEALPRPLIAIGVPCAGALLTALFLVRGFPYDALGERVASRIEQRYGVELAVASYGLAMQIAGPALEGTQLRVAFHDRSVQAIDRARIRAAWSLSWLTGDPAFHVEVESASGAAEGILSGDSETTWVGTIRDARPELPPIAGWIPTGSLKGALDAELELTLREGGPEGRVEFEIRDGSITLPGTSSPLPFESLTGQASFGGEAYANLTELRFEGPLATGSGSGKIGSADPIERAPIGFEFQLALQDELARAVRADGVKLDPGGKGLARISGTVANPKIR